MAAGSTWNVTGVFGKFLVFDVPSILNWEIRQGMVAGGSTGTVVQSGSGTWQSRALGNGYVDFRIETPSFDLSAGTYWIGIWADLTGLSGFRQFATGGAEDAGSQVNWLSNNNAIWLLEAGQSEARAITSRNFSLSVLGTTTATVPEPSAVTLLAVGLTGLVAVRRRRA